MIDRHKSLIVRLAENDSDVQAAQALRYKVFYEEMGVSPSEGAAWSKLDVDPFDEICDHLVVVDENRARENEADGRPRVVGTYRLLRRSVPACSKRRSRITIPPIFGSSPSASPTLATSTAAYCAAPWATITPGTER